MTARSRLPLALVLLCIAVTAVAEEQSTVTPVWLGADPARVALLEGMEAVMAPLYTGDQRRARAVADSFVTAYPGHPLPLIMKARVLREVLLEQDWDTELIKAEAAPIHDLLEVAVELCNRKSDADADDPAWIFYRGWSRMLRSQLHAICLSNYSAGRTAAKGHGDLERYLELRPNDPDARGFMGIYQYYAASLPALAKFLGKLLFIPGGNERMGLANMRFACAKTGPLQTDHQVVRASTYVFFAGRLEQALEYFRTLLERHPRYLRLAEPLAVSAVFYPNAQGELRRHVERVRTRHVLHLEAGADWATVRRLSYYESLAALLYRSPVEARAGLEQLVARRVARPDWMDDFARLDLACLLASAGEGERARSLLDGLAAGSNHESIRNAAQACLADSATWQNRDLAADLDWVAAIHDGRLKVARDGLGLYGMLRGQNLVHSFYSGELALVEDDLERATACFTKALELDAPVSQRLFRVFAAARLAEIAGLKGDRAVASGHLETALAAGPCAPTLTLVLKARRRFYAESRDDESTTAPSLVAARSSGRVP